MANLQGYGTNSVGNMLNHYTRHAGDPEQTKYRYANQDIDQTRTHLNYAIFARDDPAAFVQSKIDGVDVKRRAATRHERHFRLGDNASEEPGIDRQGEGVLSDRVRPHAEDGAREANRWCLGAHGREPAAHALLPSVPWCTRRVMTNDKSRPAS